MYYVEKQIAKGKKLGAHLFRHRFDLVNVVVAEPSHELREDIARDLRKLGFERIQLVSNIRQIQQALKDDLIDLLICDTALEDGDLTRFVRGMRLGIFNGNIFPVVITLVSVPSQGLVHKVVNSGTDAVIVKPITLEQLNKRIMGLVEKRSRFVVTSDYIGPDRRQKLRKGAEPIPSIDVPNPLRNKITSYYDADAYTALVKRTTLILNERRIERQSIQIKYYVEKILPPYEEQDSHTEMPPEWSRLMFTTKDLAGRVKGSRFAHMIGASTMLLDFVNDLNAKQSLTSEDIRLITQFSSSISRLFETV